MQPGPSSSQSQTSSLLLIGLWFGIVTGLIEGMGLLLFQKINWAASGHMMHVSREIVWISPLVDTLFFVGLALTVPLAVRLLRPDLVLRVLVFLLTFLTFFDWLTLTRRLTLRACLLLALGLAVTFDRWFTKHETAAVQVWRRSVPWLIAILLLVFAGTQGGQWLFERHAVAKLPPAAPGTPNVLVIVVDTLRAANMSSYEYARLTSPVIDSLAQQGVLFENVVSTCSWSLPSHVSLLTGLYLFEHGVGDLQPVALLGSEESSFGGYPTLGEALQRNGYRTGAFSANRTNFARHLGFGRGFVHFEDYFHSPADMFVRTLFGRLFANRYLNRSDKSRITRGLRWLGLESLVDRDEEGSGSTGGAFGLRKRAYVINDETLRWIDQDRQRPFFAFLNYFDVHRPYGGPRTYSKPSWEQAGPIDAYDDGVKYVDDYIGRLMKELERRGIAENSLVIITSDHGESLGRHHMETHGGSLYREAIHVPLVIWYPRYVPAGLRVATAVTNASIPATIMDLVGASESRVFPGPSLAELWRTPQTAANWPDPLSELPQANTIGDENRTAEAAGIPTSSSGWLKSLVTPQWHLIVHEKAGEQLYDWKQDPAELDNLINAPENKATALGLKTQMQAILNRPRTRQ